MFIDCFDSVKTQVNCYGEQIAIQNAQFSETYLYNLLLTGYIPCLTPAQFIDSSSFFNITNTNQDIFIKLIKSGFIKINLFPGEYSLRNHFIKSLSEGIINENSLYEFSIFPFFNNYTKDERVKIQKNIISNLNEHYTNCHVDGLKPEEAEYMEVVYDNFQIMDILLKKEMKTTKKFSQNISDLVISFSKEYQDSEFKSLFSELSSDNDGKTIKAYRRSSYYDFINRVKMHYSEDAICKLRNIVDCSYNLAIASAVNDFEGSNISTNISSIIKSQTVDTLNPQEKTKINIREKKESKTRVSWEDVYEILTEVSAIQKENNISRKDAINKYKKNQNISNVYKIGKYILGNTIKTLLPGLDTMSAVVNIVSDISINASTELADEKFKMQSITELVDDIKKTTKKNQILSNLDKSTDFFACNFPKL